MTDEPIERALEEIHKERVMEGFYPVETVDLSSPEVQNLQQVSLKDFLDKDKNGDLQNYIKQHLSESEINTLIGQNKSAFEAVEATNRKVEDVQINQKLTAEHEARLETMAKPKGEDTGKGL